MREVRLLPGDLERVALPCSVLHHVGFALPPRLPLERWALTPPFQPYLIPASGTIGGVFSAALSIKDFSRFPCPHFSRGTLPCGVRTFLNSACTQLRPSRKRRADSMALTEFWRGKIFLQAKENPRSSPEGRCLRGWVISVAIGADHKNRSKRSSLLA